MERNGIDFDLYLRMAVHLFGPASVGPELFYCIQCGVCNWVAASGVEGTSFWSVVASLGTLLRSLSIQ